jgi:hypothetical protein
MLQFYIYDGMCYSKSSMHSRMNVTKLYIFSFLCQLYRILSQPKNVNSMYYLNMIIFALFNFTAFRDS